jgi:hypothetical protein
VTWRRGDVVALKVTARSKTLHKLTTWKGIITPTTTIHTGVEGKSPLTTTWNDGGIEKPP